MEYKITLTKSGSVSSYTMSQKEYMVAYIASLVESKIDFSFSVG